MAKTDIPKQPVILCILDGWGERADPEHNAIAQANTPNWDRLKSTSAFSTLDASGNAVGLPNGQMGNSEVGHMTIGSGRITLQDLPRIDKAIANGAFTTQKEFKTFQGKTKVCHLLGLLSPGGVHSHQRHLFEAAKELSGNGTKVYIHAFLDGRDTPPRSALEYITAAQNEFSQQENIQIASLSGRYYAMDRDKRWDRVELAYKALVKADAPSFTDPLEYVKDCYTAETTDEFIKPAIFEQYPGMQPGDSLFMVNFRSDRVRQLLTALVDPKFSQFHIEGKPDFAGTLGMTQYSDTLSKHIPALFPPQAIENSLGDVISQNNLKQLRIAETEKYAHVTFFLNGGQETAYPGEERILTPSPKVATYDEKPEMSAFEVTGKLISHLKTERPDLIVVNFANTDMVGHTGRFDAIVQAVEAVDQCLGKIADAVDEENYALLITADHGNAEETIDSSTGAPLTAHSLNRVPALLFNAESDKLNLASGGLADIAPTILDIMGISAPPEMTGKSLIEGEV